MKQTALAFLLLSLVLTRINAQHYVWGRAFMSEFKGGAFAAGITVGDNHDIFVCGDYDSIVDFDEFRLQSRSGHDGFLTKLDSSGSVLWAKTLGAAKNGVFASIDKGAGGSVFVVGEFVDSLYLENDTIVSGNEPHGGVNEPVDCALLKYDGSGNVQWIKHFSGSRITRVKTDLIGNAYIFGQRFVNDMDVGVWISKYDGEGNEIFYSELFSPSTLSGSLVPVNLTVDFDENIYISGITGHEALIGNIHYSGNFDGSFVIIKCDSQGIPVWVRHVDDVQAGGFSYYSAIATDESGNVLHSTFGNLLSLSKFDPDGNVLWEKQGFQNIGMAKMLIDGQGNFIAAGRYQGTFTLDYGEFRGPAQGTFVAFFNSNGECQWSLQGENEGNNHITSIARDQETGDIYAIGDIAPFSSSSYGAITFVAPDVKRTRALVLKISPGSSYGPDLVELTIPNVITPDGDDYNQYFTIPQLDVRRNNALFIFNRLGTMVYSTSSYQNDWDGDGLTPGIYYYRLHRAPDARVYNGWVRVMR